MLHLPPLLLGLVERDLLLPSTKLPQQRHLQRVQTSPHGIHIAHLGQVVRDDDLCHIPGLLMDHSSDAYDLAIFEVALLLACDEVMGEVVRHGVQTRQETQARLDDISPLLGLFFLPLPLVRDVRVFFFDLLFSKLLRCEVPVEGV